jgi:UDP-GlcNAc:undecaprenyl-phosphate GlcNAc-1-phosphate transferase
MFDIVLALAISFVITYFSIPAIITISKLKKLYDVPDERKVHINPIASLGGVGIFAGFTLAFLITVPLGRTSEFQYVLAAALVIFFLGIKDDILVISPLKKFIGQIFAALLIIYKGGLQLKNMHGFLGLHELPDVYSWPITVLTVIVVINSFNLIDGIDGLAGSLGLMASVVFGLYFLQAGILPYAVLSFSLSGSLIAFLFFNFPPARIFMGDTGSMTIGLICSILVIRFINIAPGSIYLPVASAPAIGFSILLIPLLDTLRVFSVRIWNMKSPFTADRNHIHHNLLDRGLSQKKVTLSLVFANLGVIVLVYLGKSLGTTWLMLLMGVVYFLAINLFWLIPVPSRKAILPKAQKEPGSIPLKPVTKIMLTKKAMAE